MNAPISYEKNIIRANSGYANPSLIKTDTVTAGLKCAPVTLPNIIILT